MQKLQVNNILFWSLALAQLWHSFNLSFGASFLKNEVIQNRYMWLAIFICLAVMSAAYFIIPVRNVLMLIPLSLSHLLIILITSMAPLILIQLLKKIKLIIS
jgi:Ca2+-transporting ATPase